MKFEELTKIEKQILDVSRDKALKDKMGQLELNDRQMKSVSHLLKHEKITNREYQKITNTNRITAFRDLTDLVDKGLIEMVGRGRWTYYKMKR